MAFVLLLAKNKCEQINFSGESRSELTEKLIFVPFVWVMCEL